MDGCWAFIYVALGVCIVVECCCKVGYIKRPCISGTRVASEF